MSAKQDKKKTIHYISLLPHAKCGCLFLKSLTLRKLLKRNKENQINLRKNQNLLNGNSKWNKYQKFVNKMRLHKLHFTLANEN